MLHDKGQFDLGKRVGRGSSDAVHGYLHEAAEQYEGLAEKVTNDRSAALKCGSGDVGPGRCRIVMKLAIGMI